jgi:Rrf2 family nitric oxide-sensitive transcriptional repressor
MRLTLYTDYALRILIHLAAHGDRPCRVADVAADYRISRSHLLKVALKLGRLGFLTTSRGRTGGIALARRPEDINLGEVVRHMEDGFDLTECMRSGGNCVISSSCRLKGVVGRALEAFLGVFDGCTLADLTHNGEELRALLMLSRLPGNGGAPEPTQRGDQC